MKLALPLRIALWPASLAYGLAVRTKNWLYDRRILKSRRLRGKVISVGNLTVGGTGKTPMVIWLAEMFLAQGKRVAILTRGYRGTDGTSDEVELMKKRLGERVRFGVGADRYANGAKLETEQPVDIVLLDDGFQHRQLARDVNVLMLDGSKKLKNLWLLPAGELREPVSSCNRADMIVVTRKFERPQIEARDSCQYQLYYAQTLLQGIRSLEQKDLKYLSEIDSRPFFAFCGIGNPQSFLKDLKRWNANVVGQSIFRDHHRYSQADVDRIQEAAIRAGARGIITTEKDAQNLKSVSFRHLPAYVCVIDLSFTNESELTSCLDRLLKVGNETIA